MIGEVRDRETAAIAVEAALTGHLVFSTLHAGSACGVISRLMEMGIEPYLLTSSLRGILNQRLVRQLCPECRQPAEVGCRGGWLSALCGDGLPGPALAGGAADAGCDAAAGDPGTVGHRSAGSGDRASPAGRRSGTPPTAPSARE